MACVIGGRDIVDDRRAISKCKSIVGTPGRLLHLIRNNLIQLNYIQILVLDEADKLFTVDFRKDIGILLKALKRDHQTIASSATYADGLDKLILSYMQNAIAVSATREIPMLIGVRQFIYEAHMEITSGELSVPAIQTMHRKVKAIEMILRHLTFKQCILFSNSQLRAESFANYLTDKEWTVDLILGNQEQSVRTSTLDKFRQYKSRILITSDLMARGVDIENINLVINIDVPKECSTYLHRIGRCGRFGTKGIAITLIADDDDLQNFQKLLGRIGGNETKIAKFPDADTLKNCDLWNFTDDSFDYIHGNDENGSNSSKASDEDDENEFLNLLNGSTIESAEPILNESIESEVGIEDVTKLLIESPPNVDLEDPFSSFEGFKVDRKIEPEKEENVKTKQSRESIERHNREMLEVAKLLVDSNANGQLDLDSDPFQQYSCQVDNNALVTKNENDKLQSPHDYEQNETDNNGNFVEDDDTNLVDAVNTMNIIDEPPLHIAEGTEKSTVNAEKPRKNKIKYNNWQPTLQQSSQDLNHRWVQLYKQQVHQIIEYVSHQNQFH